MIICKSKHTYRCYVWSLPIDPPKSYTLYLWSPVFHSFLRSRQHRLSPSLVLQLTSSTRPKRPSHNSLCTSTQWSHNCLSVGMRNRHSSRVNDRRPLVWSPLGHWSGCVFYATWGKECARSPYCVCKCHWVVIQHVCSCVCVCVCVCVYVCVC